MRTKEEILEEMAKVEQAKKAAVKKQIRCVGRLVELKKELDGAANE